MKSGYRSTCIKFTEAFDKEASTGKMKSGQGDRV